MLAWVGRFPLMRFFHSFRSYAHSVLSPRDWRSCLTHSAQVFRPLPLLFCSFGARIRQTVKLDELQFGFTPERGTTDAIFIVRQLQERFRAKRRPLYCAFVIEGALSEFAIFNSLRRHLVVAASITSLPVTNANYRKTDHRLHRWALTQRVRWASSCLICFLWETIN